MRAPIKRKINPVEMSERKLFRNFQQIGNYIKTSNALKMENKEKITN